MSLMPASIEILSIGEGANLITTAQVKAARALLGWSQADLARRSGVSEPTIARLEALKGELGGRWPEPAIFFADCDLGRSSVAMAGSIFSFSKRPLGISVTRRCSDNLTMSVHPAGTPLPFNPTLCTLEGRDSFY
jgi:hypothetical protein